MNPPLITLDDYLRDRRWLYHERGLDAEWEILHKISVAHPGDTLAGDAINLVTDGVGLSGQAGDPAALYRP